MYQIELDFERAKGRHLLFKTRLRSILYGASIDDHTVICPEACSLGEWIRGRALSEFGEFDETHALDALHIQIHRLAGELIAQYRRGEETEARERLSEIEELGSHLIDQLNFLKDRVIASGIAPDFSNNLDELKVNYIELLELNNMQSELHDRIREQTQITKKAHERALENEEKFLNVTEQAPVGIVIFRGVEMIFEMVNATYVAMIGQTKEALLGRSLYDIIPDSKNTVGLHLQKVLATSVPYHGNQVRVVIDRDGQERAGYFDYIAKPYKEIGSDETTAIIVVVSEVTAQVLSKIALERSEMQFRNLVSQSPFAKAVISGPEMIITLANDAMLNKLWRRTMEEVEGKRLLEVFPELSGQKFIRILKEVFETGEIHRENEAYVEIEARDGIKAYYLDFQYGPIFEPDGTVSSVMVSANDVTEKVTFRNGISEAVERLSLATEGTKLATWDLNLLNHDIIYSSRLPLIFGREPDAKLTHAEMRRQVLPEDLRTVLLPSFERALITGIYQYEARIMMPDGGLRWIRTQGKIIFDDQQKPLRMLGTMLDITEEKESQLALKTSEGKFRTLANAMPQFVWTADKEGELNYWNDAVFKFSGLTFEQMQSGGWIGIVHPDDRTDNVVKWMDAVRTGNDFLIEHRFRRHDGVYRWQLSRAVAQKDANGKIQMWVGTSTDIHDRRLFTDELELKVAQRTKELTVMNDELTRTNMELAQFAYVASHDLQEPLRKIQTFASRILDTEFDQLSDRGKDYFSRMRASSTRMQQLIADLIAYSGSSAAEKHFEWTSLETILHRVREQLWETILRNEATVIADEMPTLEVIPFQMEQLFTNLIGNALKFTRKNCPPVVHIKSELVWGYQHPELQLVSDKQYYCISISDNGIGFDQEYQDRIFQVFQRLHSKTAYEGTGIGLSICKKIVENHSGVIHAEGKLMEGATFYVYLPEIRN
ncbi:PAS domain S-box protein [Dyadobacter tibetensis]|uniref:PAS domain S-box protein n=1 Tax=Dyadobacter tibetensis TaxID=1211851 RepID=UPI0004719007|nr:PAS domain S-box protein [Dyadobacter tibetensis]